MKVASGFISFLSVIFSFNLAVAAVNGSFGYVIGSPRVVGMGGAFTAIAEGVDAVFYNPSGLVFNRKKFFIDGSSGNIEAKDIDLMGYNFVADTNRDLTNQDYFYYGAVLTDRGGSAGFLYGSLYHMRQQISYAGYDTSYEVGVDAFIVPIAFRTGSNFALGFNLGYLKGFHRRYMAATGTDAEEAVKKAGTFSFGAGLIYRAGDFKYGLSYHHGGKIRFDSQEIMLVTDFNHETYQLIYFDDILVPPAVMGGISWSKKSFAIAFDVHCLLPQKNSGYLTGTDRENLRLKEKGSFSAHTGIELELVRRLLLLRSGYYFEQSRFIAGIDRHHYTFGIGFHFWKTTLDLAYDRATDFENVVFSTGFAF